MRNNVTISGRTPRTVRLAIMVCLLPCFAAASGWNGTGPFGGSAEIVRTVPKASGMVIAGAHNGLLYISYNGGAFWANVPFPGQLAGVLHALEVDPRSTGTWFAGVEGQNEWNSGVYKTSDGGRSWILLPQTRGLAVWSLALSPQDPAIVAAGTGSGVYLSKDAGTKWAHISAEDDAELRPVVSLAFHPTDPDTLYAGTTHLPWRTTDGGRSWQSIHDGMMDDSDVFSIQVDTRNPSRVFASACSGVYSSGNGAELWSKLDLPKGAFRTYFVAIDPKHEEIVFAGTTEGLMKSADGGHAWRSVSTEAIKSVAFDPFVPGRIFFASTTAGLLVSTDSGNTLRESNTGFTNRNFTTLTGAGMEIYASSVFEPTSGGVYRTDNMGLRWIRAGAPSVEQLLVMAAAPDDARFLFAAGYHGLLESVDSGKSWTLHRNSPPGARITALLPLSSTTLLAGTDLGLFRTTDGVAWTSLAADPVQSMNRSGGSLLFALTSAGAMKSTDRGSHWEKCGDPQSAAAWYGLAFDAGDPKTALAATSAGLFRSTDGCQSWTEIRGGLRPETASLVMFHPTRAGEAYVSQGGSVFRSNDGGQRWYLLDGEAPGNSGPSSLFVLPAVPDRLFALFPRRGVFSSTISGTNTKAAFQADHMDIGNDRAPAEGASVRVNSNFKERTIQ